MALPLGTTVNIAAICIGSIIGTVLGNRLPERVRTIIFQGIGICVAVLGIGMAQRSGLFLLVFISILLGSITGELLNLQQRCLNLAMLLKKCFKSSNPTFVDGVVTASLLFCLGSMTILGPFESALEDNHTILYTKATLDLFSSTALAARFGGGVILSAIPLAVLQLLLFVFAVYLRPFLPEPVFNELIAVGGILMIGVGLNLLELKQLALANFLPALIIVVFIARFWLL